MENKGNNVNYGAKPRYPIIVHEGVIMMFKTYLLIFMYLDMFTVYWIKLLLHYIIITLAGLPEFSQFIVAVPADFEVRPIIKFLNAQNIAPIQIHRHLCQVYGHTWLDGQHIYRSSAGRI